MALGALELVIVFKVRTNLENPVHDYVFISDYHKLIVWIRPIRLDFWWVFFLQFCPLHACKLTIRYL